MDGHLSTDVLADVHGGTPVCSLERGFERVSARVRTVVERQGGAMAGGTCQNNKKSGWNERGNVKKKKK